jgi:hypothetical protein
MSNLKKGYRKFVREGLDRTGNLSNEIIDTYNTSHLPRIVKKYLEYTGVMGQPEVANFRVTCEGQIRSSEDSAWMNFRSVQYNFFDQPSRFFYIDARKMGISAGGLHAFKNGKASMVIKLAGLFKIADARGPEMDQSETVTLFNDMCLLAPATLVSEKIKWEEIDPLTVMATFTNEGTKIGARLSFNENGAVVNFTSTDRYELSDGKVYRNFPWSTPVSEYADFGIFRLAKKADLIYSRPEGDFCYGKFIITNVEYNCREYK